MWELRARWYGDRLDAGWQPRTPGASQAILDDVGLRGAVLAALRRNRRFPIVACQNERSPRSLMRVCATLPLRARAVEDVE